jgi:hypothetical protein
MARTLCFGVLVSCFALAANISDGFACSPPAGPAPTVTERITAADSVFTGTIAAVGRNSIAVRVGRVYKGQARSAVSVTIPLSSAACGIDNMKKGDKIVVYGQDDAFDAKDAVDRYLVGIFFRSSHINGTHLGELTQEERRRLASGSRPR